MQRGEVETDRDQRLEHRDRGAAAADPGDTTSKTPAQRTGDDHPGQPGVVADGLEGDLEAGRGSPLMIRT